jgi:DNA-binding MarR family transcriptional regulator
VGIIEQLARNRFERAQADGLRLPHFTVLNHLVRLGDGRTPGQLARAFQLTKATMTNTLQRLEARGFIRVEADPEDGRGKRVFLTEAGRARRQAAVAALARDLAALDATPGLDAPALLPGLGLLRAALDKAR